MGDSLLLNRISCESGNVQRSRTHSTSQYLRTGQQRQGLFPNIRDPEIVAAYTRPLQQETRIVVGKPSPESHSTGNTDSTGQILDPFVDSLDCMANRVPAISLSDEHELMATTTSALDGAGSNGEYRDTQPQPQLFRVECCRPCSSARRTSSLRLAGRSSDLRFPPRNVDYSSSPPYIFSSSPAASSLPRPLPLMLSSSSLMTAN